MARTRRPVIHVEAFEPDAPTGPARDVPDAAAGAPPPPGGAAPPATTGRVERR
jgi:hypothetical protein